MTDPRPSRFLIYGLIDPRDRCLRYIGKTHKRREIRLQEHIDRALSDKDTHVYRWLRMLLACRQQPEIFVIERVPGTDSWEAAERRQIACWRAARGIDFPYTHPPQTRKSTPTLIRSVRLTNVHDGGVIGDDG